MCMGEIPSKTPLAGVQWSEPATIGSKEAPQHLTGTTTIRKTTALIPRTLLRLFFLGVVPQPLSHETYPARQQGYLA